MTQYGYDADGRQTGMTLLAVPTYDPTTGTVQLMDLTTTYAYNADGRQTLVTDPLGHKTAYLYDALGRVTKTTYDDGTFMTTAYDALGRKSSETDQLGRTTSYKYDAAGRLSEVDQPAVPNPQDLDTNGNPKLDVPVGADAGAMEWKGRLSEGTPSLPCQLWSRG